MRVRDKHMLVLPVPHFYGVLAISACLSLIQSGDLSVGGFAFVWFYTAVAQGFKHNRTYLVWIVLGCTFSICGFCSLLSPLLPLLWFWDTDRIKYRFDYVRNGLDKLSDCVENQKNKLVQHLIREYPTITVHFHQPRVYTEWVEEYRESFNGLLHWLEKKRVISTPAYNFDETVIPAVTHDPIYDEMYQKIRILILVNAIGINVFVLGNLGILVLALVGLVLLMEDSSIKDTSSGVIKPTTEDPICNGSVLTDTSGTQEEDIDPWTNTDDENDNDECKNGNTTSDPALSGLGQIDTKRSKKRVKIRTGKTKPRLHDKQTNDLLRRRKNRVSCFTGGVSSKDKTPKILNMDKIIVENRHEVRKHDFRFKINCKQNNVNQGAETIKVYHDYGSTNHGPRYFETKHKQITDDKEHTANKAKDLKSHTRNKLKWRETIGDNKAMASREILETLSRIGMEKLLTHWERNKADQNIAKQYKKQTLHINTKPTKPKWWLAKANTTVT